MQGMLTRPDSSPPTPAPPTPHLSPSLYPDGEKMPREASLTFTLVPGKEPQRVDCV